MTDAAVRFCMMCGRPVSGGDPAAPAPCPACSRTPARVAGTRRSSALAVASFILGLTGCVFPVAPLTAIGYGAVALYRIRRSCGTLTGSAWAWWGTALGAAWILLVVVLFISGI